MIVAPLIAAWMAAWATIHPTGPIVPTLIDYSFFECHLVGDSGAWETHKPTPAEIAVAPLHERHFKTLRECEAAAKKILQAEHSPGGWRPGAGHWQMVCNC
jgi:hypothetical protein